ncbi:hypothetical protein [Dactylosporangium sp. NPDC051484]
MGVLITVGVAGRMAPRRAANSPTWAEGDEALGDLGALRPL